MFDRWRRAFEAGEPLHQVFVTVSATLKDQVGRVPAPGRGQAVMQPAGCMGAAWPCCGVGMAGTCARRPTQPVLHHVSVGGSTHAAAQPTLALPPQVAKAFVRLRNGLPAVTADRAAVYAAAASQTYHSFRGLPEEAWPLFLSSKQYLHMLDGGSQRLCRRRREVSALASHGVSCTRSPARPMRIDPIPDALAGWR